MSKIRYPFEEPPTHENAIEIAEGVLWLRLPLPMALDHVNIYALDDGESWTVVDTGFRSKTSIRLWEDVLAGPLGGKPVGRVILTHHHPDHVGMASFLTERGAELVTTRTAYLLTRMLTADEQPNYPRKSLELYKRWGMADDILRARETERPFNFADCVGQLDLGYTRIQDGETLVFGGRCWMVRTGDGHAPEHATFWSLDDDLVIGGDQLLPSISPNIGVHPTEPEANPLAEWLASCEKFVPLAEDRHFVLGGHKLPFYGLPLRLKQMIENHHGALDRLAAFLETPRKGGECFPPLFKREITSGIYGLAIVETVAHLNYLHQAGRARRWLDDDGSYRWQRN